MNRNQVEGTLKGIAGKAQRKAGEITGSTSQQIKGIDNQVDGKTQKMVGDIEKAAKDMVDRSGKRK